jgi:hypothetical protein
LTVFMLIQRFRDRRTAARRAEAIARALRLAPSTDVPPPEAPPAR